MDDAKKRLELRPIRPGSREYEAELLLRDEVLRRPLGMQLRDEDLSAEREQLHFGAFRTGALLGVAILAPTDEPSAMRLRQVAVLPQAQRQGVGSRLVRYAEGFAAARGARKIRLHARKTALPFYRKLGYRAEGSEFVEVTLPHRAMSRLLTETPPAGR